SRLLPIASRMSSCSAGSSNTCHHGASASDSPCAASVTKRDWAGVGTAGRTNFGPTGAQPQTPNDTTAAQTTPAPRERLAISVAPVPVLGGDRRYRGSVCRSRGRADHALHGDEQHRDQADAE